MTLETDDLARIIRYWDQQTYSGVAAESLVATDTSGGGGVYPTNKLSALDVFIDEVPGWVGGIDMPPGVLSQLYPQGPNGALWYPQPLIRIWLFQQAILTWAGTVHFPQQILFGLPIDQYSFVVWKAIPGLTVTIDGFYLEAFQS